MSRSIKLAIESQHLGPNLKNAIYQKLKCLEGTCTKDGCVLEITQLGDIISAYIDRSNNVNIFNVKYQSNVFLPVLNTTYTSVVVASFPEGTIINVNNCPCITAIVMNKNFPVGSHIDIILKEIVYIDNRFQCVAKVI